MKAIIKTKLFTSTMPVLFIVILLSGCQVDQIEDIKSFRQKELTTIEATYEFPDMDTKTVRDDNAKIYWTPGDAISLFYDSGTNGGSKFIAQNDAVALKTTFSGSITAVTGGSDMDEDDCFFWGLYPYDETASCDGRTVTMRILSEQPGMEGTFAPGFAPSLGRSQKLALPFRNIWSGFGFTVSEAGYQTVTFKGNNNEDLAGRAKIGIDANGLPYVVEILEGIKEVTITAPTNAGFVPGEYYYMQFFPGTLTKGFTVTIASTEKAGEYVYSKEMVFPRSTWKRAAEVDTRVEADDWMTLLTKSVPEEGGVVELEVVSDVPCYPVIPDEAQSWISIAPATKAMAKQSIDLIIQPNIGLPRSATINVVAEDDASNVVLSFTVTQEVGGVWKEGTVPPDNEIWYTTSDNEKVDLYTTHGFGAKVLSNEYSSGRGIIRFSGAVTSIASNMFPPNGSDRITHVMIPETVVEIQSSAFYNCFSLVDFRIPESVTSLGVQCFMNCYSLREINISSAISDFGFGVFNCDYNLERFTGDYPGISEDGRCLIVDNCLNSFAPKGIEEYSFPSGIETIGFGAVSDIAYLRRISFPNTLKHIEERAFDGCGSLEDFTLPEGLIDIGQWAFRGIIMETVHIPSTVEYIGNAAFGDCDSIKQFTGKFASKDGLFLIVNGEIVSVAFSGLGKSVSIPEGVTIIGNQVFMTHLELGIEELVFPEGMTTIGEQAFMGWDKLKTVVLPSTVENFGGSTCYIYAGGNPFEECHNLEAFEGNNPYISADKRCIILNDFLVSFAPGGLTEYTIPSGVKTIGFSVFGDYSPLESIILPEGLEAITMRAFRYCTKIKSVTIPSSINYIYCDAFFGCDKLQTVYCKALIPPFIENNYEDYSVFPFDQTSDNLVIYVPNESLELYKRSDWGHYSSRLVGYKYDDIDTPDYYWSTDYTSDGTISTLQQSTTGSGIDLILMGDAFSDRQIADGTYANVMQKAADAFFSEEPYKSMKDLFNVYTVNVVSATEGYEHEGQAFSTGHGDGSYVYGNDAKVVEYAKKAIGEDRLDDALVIVMMNEDAYAGTCFMYDPPSGDYGRGLSIAYFPTSSDTNTFNGLVSHEAGGHGFAKLADEYAYEEMGAISPEEIANAQGKEQYGWWKNVDFTSDPDQVKWSRFLSDSRYASEGLGCFEGGLTYWSGVWRPTENSIMRYNTGGFNAPSRYAIWYRIGKLAYGEDWNGTYEDFVAYDAINRTPAATTKRQKASSNYVLKQRPPLAPPVVVGHSWREAKEE